MSRRSSLLALALGSSLVAGSMLAIDTPAYARKATPVVTSEPKPVPATTTVPKDDKGSSDVKIPENKAAVEVVFVLDTTGSMGGLIDGAKRKIWYIANEIVKAKQKPVVKIGLIAYRDKGDAYVSKMYPMTDNLDAVYETLMGFQADGGGDGPEHVNQALDDAVHKVQWSDRKDVLKLVFLVGDAPPHMDYQDDVKYSSSSQDAVRKNIYINTIQCGSDMETTRVWQDIAHKSEGRYAAIQQDGGVVAVATPFDEDLRRLADEIDDTNLYYGSEVAQQSNFEKKERTKEAMRAAPAAAAADRASFKGMSSAPIKAAEEDIVTLSENSNTDDALKNVRDDQLPKELRGKSKDEQKAIVEKMKQKRQNLQQQINAIQKKREQYINEENKKRAASGDSFDSEVVESIHKQAAEVGLTY